MFTQLCLIYSRLNPECSLNDNNRNKLPSSKQICLFWAKTFWFSISGFQPHRLQFFSSPVMYYLDMQLQKTDKWFCFTAKCFILGIQAFIDWGKTKHYIWKNKIRHSDTYKMNILRRASILQSVPIHTEIPFDEDLSSASHSWKKYHQSVIA